MFSDMLVLVQILGSCRGSESNKSEKEDFIITKVIEKLEMEAKWQTPEGKMGKVDESENNFCNWGTNSGSEWQID